MKKILNWTSTRSVHPHPRNLAVPVQQGLAAAQTPPSYFSLQSAPPVPLGLTAHHGQRPSFHIRGSPTTCLVAAEKSTPTRVFKLKLEVRPSYITVPTAGTQAPQRTLLCLPYSVYT